MEKNVPPSLSRLLITTKKLKPPFMRSQVGLTNIMKNVAINAFPAMSDAKVTTLENVLRNVIAAQTIISTVVMEQTITQPATITMPLEKENLFIVTIGAAQKITPTVMEIVFLMSLASHMVMDLQTHPQTTMVNL